MTIPFWQFFLLALFLTKDKMPFIIRFAFFFRYIPYAWTLEGIPLTVRGEGSRCQKISETYLLSYLDAITIRRSGQWERPFPSWIRNNISHGQ